MIVEELRQIKRLDTSADEPLKIAPKEDVKEAIGRSPDYSDMMMMRMYFILLKEVRKPEYNPVDEEKVREAGASSKWGGVPFDL